MLQQLLQDEMRSRGVSAREASRQIGVAHTTISRALQGKRVDVATIELISKWLGVRTNELLLLQGDHSVRTADKLAGLLSRNPRLAAAMDRLIELYEEREIEQGVITDVLAYLSFRVARM